MQKLKLQSSRSSAFSFLCLYNSCFFFYLGCNVIVGATAHTKQENKMTLMSYIQYGWPVWLNKAPSL